MNNIEKGDTVVCVECETPTVLEEGKKYNVSRVVPVNNGLNNIEVKKEGSEQTLGPTSLSHFVKIKKFFNYREKWEDLEEDDKMICICDRGTHHDLEKGTVYTISDATGPLRLKELDDISNQYLSHRRFEKVVEDYSKNQEEEESVGILDSIYNLIICNNNIKEPDRQGPEDLEKGDVVELAYKQDEKLKYEADSSPADVDLELGDRLTVRGKSATGCLLFEEIPTALNKKHFEKVGKTNEKLEEVYLFATNRPELLRAIQEVAKQNNWIDYHSNKNKAYLAVNIDQKRLAVTDNTHYYDNGKIKAKIHLKDNFEKAAKILERYAPEETLEVCGKGVEVLNAEKDAHPVMIKIGCYETQLSDLKAFIDLAERGDVDDSTKLKINSSGGGLPDAEITLEKVREIYEFANKKIKRARS